MDLEFVPSATYRLQFQPAFTFADATAILDYLEALGISDVYSSPYFQSGAGSTHGYDVADHNRINPALGGEAGYRAFVSELRTRKMGQVLDFVPNHMGISEPINRWWMDVLENGPMSLHEGYFDIEWHPLKHELENKVLLPILGDRYGRVLENGEFQLTLEGGAFFVRYHEAKLPLNPRTYPRILNHAASQLGTGSREEEREELQSIARALADLPEHSAAQREDIERRDREKEVSKRRLARLVAQAPEVAAALAQRRIPPLPDAYRRLAARSLHRRFARRIHPASPGLHDEGAQRGEDP
jgi:(1->4)-alpha-D-glucan 1-alpha-D-glucosylmutase